MGNIFDFDNEPKPREEGGKSPSIESEEVGDTSGSIAIKSRSKKTAVVLVGLVVLGLLVTLGAIWFYLLRSSDKSGSPGATSKDAKTKLEAFQGKAGIVLVKSFSEVGSVAGTSGGSVEINAMELQDRSNGTTASGLIVNVKPQGEYSHESRSFIDHDEIDSLLKGIDYIKSVTAPTPPLKSFEAHYRTRGDFAIVTFNKSDGTIAAAVTGNSIGSNNVFLSTQDLSTLRSHVITAKELLDKIER